MCDTVKVSRNCLNQTSRALNRWGDQLEEFVCLRRKGPFELWGWAKAKADDKWWLHCCVMHICTVTTFTSGWPHCFVILLLAPWLWLKVLVPISTEAVTWSEDVGLVVFWMDVCCGSEGSRGGCLGQMNWNYLVSMLGWMGGSRFSILLDLKFLKLVSL